MVASLSRSRSFAHELPAPDFALAVLKGKRFHEMSKSNDKTLKLSEGYVHDPLNDVGKETVMADITSWLEAHA